MSIDRFQPAKDYDALKKQAFALHSLLQAQQGELSLLRRQHNLVSRYETHQALLDSEREANAKLTERVLELEAALERASGDAPDKLPSAPFFQADNNELVIEYDQDGYPTEATLDAIAGFCGSPERLLEAIRPLFMAHGRCEQNGHVWVIVTGGWSGCESVIRAMQKNTAFWSRAWYLSKRGGYHEFDLGEIYDD